MTRTWMTVRPPPVPRDPPASIEWAPSPASAHLDAQVQTEGMLGGDMEGKREPQSGLLEPCPSVSHRPPVPPGRHVFEPAMPRECPVQHQPSDRLYPLHMPARLLRTHLPPRSG